MADETKKYWPATSETEYTERMTRARDYLSSRQASCPFDLDDLCLYDLEYLVYEQRRWHRV